MNHPRKAKADCILIDNFAIELGKETFTGTATNPSPEAFHSATPGRPCDHCGTILQRALVNYGLIGDSREFCSRDCLQEATRGH